MPATTRRIFNKREGRKRIKNGFTLVELLVVMGVLAVLAVTILVSLNPAEAGKKARDTKRMKDLATLEAIVLQWIQDGREPFCQNRCRSTENDGKQDCNNSWIQTPGDGGSPVDLCNYVKSVPVDPANGKVRSYISGGTVTNPTMNNANLYYMLQMSGSDYKIGVLQESKFNAKNTLNDGSPNNWAERGSDMNLW